MRAILKRYMLDGCKPSPSEGLPNQVWQAQSNVQKFANWLSKFIGLNLETVERVVQGTKSLNLRWRDDLITALGINDLESDTLRRHLVWEIDVAMGVAANPGDYNLNHDNARLRLWSRFPAIAAKHMPESQVEIRPLTSEPSKNLPESTENTPGPTEAAQGLRLRRRPFEFLRLLPAELHARRSAVRVAVAEILASADTAPDSSSDRIAWRTLKREWPSHTLPNPRDDQAAADEAHMLFLEFGLAIKACNESTPRWGIPGAATTLGSFGRQALAGKCTDIAKLLLAMAWTAPGWDDLPNAVKDSRWHDVAEPTLLTAGKEMRQGRNFRLPDDPTYADTAPGLAGRWRAPDKWNFGVLLDINAGIGSDATIQLVDALADQFNAKRFEYVEARAQPKAVQLDKFLLDFSQVLLSHALQEGRVLTVSKSFAAASAPGFDDFFDFVKSLRDEKRPMVDGLAFSGHPGGHFLRCNEILLLNQIRFCRDHIAAIP